MTYFRRPDLTPDIRRCIAAQAILCQGLYGSITALAKQYHCCRQFVYDQLNVFNAIFASADFAPFYVDKDKNGSFGHLLRCICMLRLECAASIGSIASFLNEFDVAPHSTGFISQMLTSVGKKIPGVIVEKPKQTVFIASDEIFAGSQPILITIEPYSMAILKMELAPQRDGVTWEKHWSELKTHKIDIAWVPGKL